MKDNAPSKIVFDLPPIKFSGRSAVKELTVRVHAKVDKENRVLEFLKKRIIEQIPEENTGKKESKKYPNN